MSGVLVLELNELNREVVSNLVTRGELPNFSRLADTHVLLETHADEAYEHLEPWIQWVTVHTGLERSDHGAEHLTDGQHSSVPQIWDVLEDAGIPCGVVSAMNGRRAQSSTGFYIPDPWSEATDTHPEQLGPIYCFLRDRVHSHNSTLERGASKIGFLARCVAAGLSAQTISRLGRGYLQARLNGRAKWKLAAEFDRFLFDLTLALRRRFKTEYTSVFLNSVAHYQHHYWTRHDRRNWAPKYPALFAQVNPLEELNLEPEDDPVTYGLEGFDQIIGSALSETSADRLVVLTGLTQQPFEGYEGARGFYLYRPYDHAVLLHDLSIRFARIVPLMSRDLMMYFDSDLERKVALERLQAVTVNDEPLFKCAEQSDHRLSLTVSYTFPSDGNTQIDVPYQSASLPFLQYLQFITFKTGHHSAQGSMYVPRDFWEKYGRTRDLRIPLRDAYRILLALARTTQLEQRVLERV